MLLACGAIIQAPGANMIAQTCGLDPHHDGKCKSEVDVLKEKLAHAEERIKQETEKGIAKWVKGSVASAMFGSFSWSVRQDLARCIENGTWRDPEINRDEGPR
jgi:hypothetical protein